MTLVYRIVSGITVQADIERELSSNTPITRDTVKDMTERSGLSEAEVLHMALSRLARGEFPSYEADEAPLSARDLRNLRKIADAALPTGQTLTKLSLF